MPEGFDHVLYEREKALALATDGLNLDQRAAWHAFTSALALSMLGMGAWHRQTLNILYHFGKAVKQWGGREKACGVMKECCTGLLYRFGSAHPDFLRAYHEFRAYDQEGDALRGLGRFASLDADEQRSVAFRHVCIDTIDILNLTGMNPVQIEEIITRASVNKPVPFPTHRRRMLVRCREDLGDFKTALERLEFDLQKDKQTWERIILGLDNVRLMSRTASASLVSSLAADLLHDIGRLSKAAIDQSPFKAVCRVLRGLGVIHFSPSSAMGVVDEQRDEILGTGTYAVVDSIRVGQELYARKSIAMPRFRQQQAREAIQNEISIIRTLDHPHIINVFFTYETSSRFFIVMEPLAECDLETFLVQHSSTPPTERQQVMVWKWLLCLSNTLTFIHSKGIRHKDIKSRNILVKGRDVILADFGSSHAFLDGGDSTTEGPSYGHTKLYCAPEVIEHQRRGRSADVFSLGCVFTELAVWLVGQVGFDINAWHAYRNETDGGMETNAYHASLSKVAGWFETCGREFVRTLYWDVLDRMLDSIPERRPPAVEISLSLQTLIDDGEAPMEPGPCKKCYLGLWINDDRFPIPSLLPQSATADPGAEKVFNQEQNNEDTVVLEGLDDLRIRES